MEFQYADVMREIVQESAADYVEARFHQREKTKIVLRRGEVEDSISEVYSGVGIRVLHGGAWGFSSINSTNKTLLRETLKTATKMARASSLEKEQKTRLQDAAPVVGKFSPDVKDPLENHSLEEKVELCTETDELVLSCEGISSSFVHYQETIDSKWIITSEGGDVQITDSKPQFYVGAIAGQGNQYAVYVDAVGITGGWELFKKRTPESMVEKATSTSLGLLNAKHPKGGEAVVILDPALVGLLSHEAVGHTTEADLVLGGSITKDKIGQEVASEYITLIDSGKIQASGWVPVDDEGVECRDVALIENGVLTGFLHNRETASIMGVEPTGNARAWEYDFEPIIRMRNTYIEKGEWKEEEIIEDTKRGYILKGADTGHADANAQFVFETKEAYAVENGEVKELLRGVIITGNAFHVLKSVDAVGRNFGLGGGFGTCRKNQPAKIDSGGPTVRCRVLVGGR